MHINEIVRLALEEDIKEGDITSESIYNVGDNASAKIIAKEDGIVCGLEIANQVFQEVDNSLEINLYKKDGDVIKNKEIVMGISGGIISILKGERVALNFLQRLSGISSKTSKFVGTLEYAKVYDTRKTTPLLRELEKHAVKIGGGENHRFGLFDEVLIKENHIFKSGGISNAINKIRDKYPNKRIEIEVKDIDEFLEALDERADIILLDNMNIDDIEKCLNEIKDFRPLIEVSGGITLENIKKYDIAGVDRISVGGLTHSVDSLDFSLIVD